MRILDKYGELIGVENPLVCDIRSLQTQAEQAGNTAAQTGGQYGSEAQGIYGSVVPQLERWTTTPPGYAPTDLAAMQTAAMASGAGAAGNAEEQMRLRAQRTGNAAALPWQQAAAAQSGARYTGSAIQDILSRNAQLKAEQQRQAFSELGNMYGTAGKLGVEAQGLVPEDVKAGTAASSQGWFQNLMNYMKTASGVAAAASGQ